MTGTFSTDLQFAGPQGGWGSVHRHTRCGSSNKGWMRRDQGGVIVVGAIVLPWRRGTREVGDVGSYGGGGGEDHPKRDFHIQCN